MTPFLQQFFSYLGWMSIHSLWIGAIVALLTWTVLKYVRHLSLDSRYWLTVFSLGTVFMTSLLLAHPKLNPLNGNHNFTSAEISEDNIIQKEYWIKGKWIGVGYRQAALDTNPMLPLYRTGHLVSLMAGGITFLFGIVGILKYTIAFQSLRLTVRNTELVHFGSPFDEDKRIPLHTNTQIKTPFVFGFWKAKLFLPKSMLKEPNNHSGALDAVLMHEMAHIERRDHLINSAQLFLESFFFHNPSIRWISALIRDLREYCCDHQAAKQFGNRFEYARSILACQVSEWDPSPRFFKMGLHNHSMCERIESLCNYTPPKIPSINPIHWLIPLSLIVILSLSTFHPTIQRKSLELISPGLLTEKLVANYEMNWNDGALEQQFDGQIHGCRPTIDRFGDPSGATLFDGKNDFIKVTGVERLKIKETLTASTWIKPESHHNFMSWLSKSINEKNYSQWRVGFGFNQEQWGFTQYTHSGRTERKNAWYDFWVNDYKFPEKSWVHVVSVVNVPQGWNRLYVNGHMVAQIPFIKPFIVDDSPLLIGYQYDDDVYFNGAIDDIKIYNRSLNATEVYTLFIGERP